MGKVQNGEEGNRELGDKASNVGIGPWSTRSGARARACYNEDDVESDSSEVAAQAAAGAGVNESDMERKKKYTLADALEKFVRMMMLYDYLGSILPLPGLVADEALVILSVVSGFVNRRVSTIIHGILHPIIIRVIALVWLVVAVRVWELVDGKPKDYRPVFQ